MECRKIQEDLSAYVDGQISPEETTRIEEHLYTCNECSRDLAELRAAVARVRELTELDPPPWLAGKVMAQVTSEAEKKRGLYKRFFSQFLLPRPIHALAAILVLVLSVYVFQTMKTSVQVARAPVEKNKEVPPENRRDVEPAGEAGQIPAVPPPSERERTTRLEEEISLEDRREVDKTDDRFRELGTDTAGEGFANMDGEMGRDVAGGRISRAPGRVPAMQEKAAEAPAVEVDEYAGAPAGIASKKHGGAPAKKMKMRAQLPGGTVRMVLTVESPERASKEIEKVLEEYGGMEVRKDFSHAERVLIHAMVPRKNLTSLSERLEKIGKVNAETTGVAGEMTSEDTAPVTIEVVSPEDKVN